MEHNHLCIDEPLVLMELRSKRRLGHTYAPNGSSSVAESPPKGALEVETVDDQRRGGSFEDYVMSTAPEARAFESSSMFSKAEGSKGWRGVV